MKFANFLSVFIALHKISFRLAKCVPTPCCSITAVAEVLFEQYFFLTVLNGWFVIYAVKICCIIYRSIKF